VRRGLFLAAALFAFTMPVLAADIVAKVTARPLPGFSISEPGRVHFGGLDWVGGFEVRSDRRELGGLSGLVVADGGGRLLTMSDDGLMVKAGISRDDHGRPVGLTGTVIRRMQTTEGMLSARKELSDSEGLDVYPGPDGRPYGVVSFEQQARVLTGPLTTDGFIGPLKAVAIPKEVNRLSPNRSLESVAALPANNQLGGRFIILGEAAEPRAGTEDQPGWVIGGRAPIAFRVRRSNGYDLTDAKVGPDGRLYVLERRFALLEGVDCRIRVFNLGDIRPGAVIDGRVLFEASMAEQIDNMEGLSIWRTASGETHLSLISDDNRLFLQRTLYLEFRLARP